MNALLVMVGMWAAVCSAVQDSGNVQPQQVLRKLAPAKLGLTISCPKKDFALGEVIPIDITFTNDGEERADIELPYDPARNSVELHPIVRANAGDVPNLFCPVGHADLISVPLPGKACWRYRSYDLQFYFMTIPGVYTIQIEYQGRRGTEGERAWQFNGRVRSNAIEVRRVP